MAGLRFNVANQNLQAITTSPKTILRVTAAAAIGLNVRRITITGDSTNTAAPKTRAEILRGASGGTAGAGTPVKSIVGGHTGSIQAAAAENFSAEPTATQQVGEAMFHPQSGWIFDFPTPVLLNPGEALVVRLTGGGSHGARVNADCEE